MLGAIATQLADATLASLLFAPALAAVVARYPSQLTGHRRAVAVTQLLIVSAFCLLASVPVAVLVVSLGNHQPSSLGFVAPYAVFFGAAATVRSLYFVAERPRRYVRAEGVSWALFLIVTLVAGVLRAPTLLPVAYLLQAAVFIVLTLADHADLITLRNLTGHVLSARSTIGFGVVNALGSLPSMATPQLAVLLIFGTAGPADAGVYAAVVSLVTPVQLVPRALSQAVFPRIARLRSESFDGGSRMVVDLTHQLATWAFGTAVLAIGTSPLWLPVMLPEAPSGKATFALLLVAQMIVVVAVPAVSAQSAGPFREVVKPALWSMAGLLVTTVVWIFVPVTPAPILAALGVVAGAAVRAGGPLASFLALSTSGSLRAVTALWGIAVILSAWFSLAGRVAEGIVLGMIVLVALVWRVPELVQKLKFERP